MACFYSAPLAWNPTGVDTEALAIEKLHGADAPRWIAERIGALALEGEYAGVERFCAIAACLDQVLSAQLAPITKRF